MRIVGTVAPVLIAALFASCTPMSETIARRPASDPAQERTSKLALVMARQEEALEGKADPVTRVILRSYGRIVREYAERYGFDWRLVLAVMKNESGFVAEAVSPKGATGLMQIMPVTGMELARTLDLESLSHPADNIHGGVLYLHQLYQLFDRARPFDRVRLMLAAYNAGMGRIYDAQEMVAHFHGNPMKWSAVREALPLLSRSFCELHKDIWTQERPRTGWFGNAQETVTYVDRIMAAYDTYCTTFN